jgi:hypothetical protein
VEWRKRENNGRDEPNWGTIYVYMEMPQRNRPDNYCMLIKAFF